jgi:hypothetical protein
MKVQDLPSALIAHEIRPEVLCLNGIRTAAEQYCIEKRADTWVVYYFERGDETGLKQFSKEEEACTYVLNLLRADPTTHTRPRI